MAFLGKLKSVFGFSSEEYDIEDDEFQQRDATVTPLAQRRQNASDNISTSDSIPNFEVDGKPTDTDMTQPEEQTQSNCPEAIFYKVVEIFNESLPTFLRESIDPEKQAKYIHDALDESMKEYIAKLYADADTRMKIKVENGQALLRREIETLREKLVKIEETNTEWKEQKLSAERQKRALSERVHDLEKQIASFNAEKEQYELENKSLVNKLRAMSIQDGDMEALRKENEELRNEINALKDGSTATIVPAVDQETIKQLNTLKDTLEDLSAQKENLLRERNMLANDIVVLKKKCEISDAMLNDLNQKASSAKIALSEKEVQYNELLSKYNSLTTATSATDDLESQLQEALSLLKLRQDELTSANESLTSARTELQRVNSELHNESAKVQELTNELRQTKDALSNSLAATDTSTDEIAVRDAKIATLQDIINQKQNELQKAKNEIEESRSSLTAFEESLVKIDEINEARQNRISELQHQLEAQNATIENKDSEIASLKSTIENNIQLQAASEALLREEIERLRKTPDTTSRQRRKKAPQISSIDESLDDTNWLVSTPPEGTNARPTGVSDSEFGYQAPHHRDEPNNPAQMLLW